MSTSAQVVPTAAGQSLVFPVASPMMDQTAEIRIATPKTAMNVTVNASRWHGVAMAAGTVCVGRPDFGARRAVCARRPPLSGHAA